MGQKRSQEKIAKYFEPNEMQIQFVKMYGKTVLRGNFIELNAT